MGNNCAIRRLLHPIKAKPVSHAISPCMNAFAMHQFLVLADLIYSEAPQVARHECLRYASILVRSDPPLMRSEALQGWALFGAVSSIIHSSCLACDYIRMLVM